jgi:GNAT superfamily N-acetyltransferase
LLATEISQAEIENHAVPLQYVTALPFALLNGVMRANFTDEEADQKIAETLEYFKSRQLPMVWVIFPSSRPANLRERLAAHGLVAVEEDTGMELDLATLLEIEDTAPGLDLRRVEDESALNDWIGAYLKGFGLPEVVGEVVFKTFMEIGFNPDAPLHNFLAYLDDKPVATSTVFFSDGIAGIYDVTTVEEARGRGIGRAVTRSALFWSRDKGYKVAVLEATTMGYSVYRKIGFIDNCKLGMYAWIPETTGTS